AEMGINLFIPKTAAEFSSIGPGTAGFAVSFVLIAIVWWIHQRLFKTFFTLSTLTVVMNVAMLGSLVLMVYFQQISLHFIVTEDRPTVAVQLWLVSYGVVYALLAGMLWIGLRDRWATLSVADLRWGLTRATLASAGDADLSVKWDSLRGQGQQPQPDSRSARGDRRAPARASKDRQSPHSAARRKSASSELR
ncbi:MAG TPA: TMEM175 family protein, partial [Candidatus Tumulicola sp.]